MSLPDKPSARQAAAAVVVDVMHELAEQGDSVLKRVLMGVASPQCEVHYPAGDVVDACSGYRYYYHSHAAQAWQRREHGHFHLFSTEGKAYTHLMALAIDARGLPLRMFTTNRWVTGETWRPHAEVFRLLQDFQVQTSGATALVDRWLTALMKLFIDPARQVLLQRDLRLQALLDRGRNVQRALEDRRIHVLSQARLSLLAQIEAVG